MNLYDYIYMYYVYVYTAVYIYIDVTAVSSRIMIYTGTGTIFALVPLAVVASCHVYYICITHTNTAAEHGIYSL